MPQLLDRGEHRAPVRGKRLSEHRRPLALDGHVADD
jgi:hypothetical protein